jgi:hypothetical protein
MAGERPLEVCVHCGKLIKRTGSRAEYGRDPVTGVVSYQPGNGGWVHTLTQSAVCRGVEHPNSPWLWAATPRRPVPD